MVQKTQHYTFGDTDLAAQRLRLLASVFEPSSASLLRGLEHAGGALGVDLGCGPGYTTRLVADHVALERVVGLDQSERLLQQAIRESGDSRVSFTQCDISNSPLPVPPADFFYARFLLTHLREPAQVVRAWASSALPNARLVLEETAFMRGEHPAFARYYALVERMQAHYGQRMYVGRELAALGESPEWLVELAQIAESRLSAADMARLHYFNLQTWSNDAFAQANYAASDLAELGSELERIANGELSASPVSLGMGQAVLRRR
ncbi:MAG: class I SAM-dependent methyltransferase [Pseudomonadota bacterium]